MESPYIQLPRNYNFIARLPEYFEIEILRKGQATSDGIWYYVRIQNHELNLLSRVDLREGMKYQIRKKGPMALELTDKKPEALSDPDNEYLG
ncbi:MAG: hypothetical protein OEV66_08240 [Spirochaetia bacterium]|nr:hypothetical protein [Spirochaetia bacterium]